MTETPGSILRSARKQKEWDLGKAADRLKLSREKVAAIENNNFYSFQSDVFVVGILRRYANVLKIESDYIIQLYNRDFKKDLKRVDRRSVQADDELTQKKSRGTFVENFLTRKALIILSGFAIVIFFAFSIFQVVNNSLNPPDLRIDLPLEAQAPSEIVYTTEQNTLIIRGDTERNTVVKINNIPVNVKTGFNFESDPLPITSEENVINIEATNNLGIKSHIKLIVQRIFKKVETKEDN